MRKLARKLAAVTAAAGLAFALGWGGPEDDASGPPEGVGGEWFEEALGPRSEVFFLRLCAKGMVAREAAEGRRTLLEAAALFGTLNRLPPEARLFRHIPADPWPDLPGRTDEELLCRQVIAFAGVALRGSPRIEAEAAANLLAAEFHAELQARGVIVLPDPATLESAESLMERAREAAR